MVIVNSFNFNSMIPVILTELDTNSWCKRGKVEYKIDNFMPFNIFKILFPKAVFKQ